MIDSSKFDYSGDEGQVGHNLSYAFDNKISTYYILEFMCVTKNEKIGLEDTLVIGELYFTKTQIPATPTHNTCAFNFTYTRNDDNADSNHRCLPRRFALSL